MQAIAIEVIMYFLLLLKVETSGIIYYSLNIYLKSRQSILIQFFV